MNVSKVKCEFCGRMISKSNITKHIRSHEIREAWNKCLTKESDSHVNKVSSSKKSKVPHSELSYSLDDDGELYNKYKQKRSNALYTQKKGFNLTFEEYCQLVNDAGLVSSQLGYKGEGYVLARFNDEGSYEYGNCRFITQTENLAERKVADAWYDSLKKAQEASMKWRKENPDEFRRRCKEGYNNSSIIQARLEIFKKKRQETELKKKHLAEVKLEERRLKEELNKLEKLKRRDKYLRQHHWITTGSINTMWYPDDGPIPEGYFLGRSGKTNQYT